MKKILLLLLFITIAFIESPCQEDPLFLAAQQRYPSLIPCDISGTQSRLLCGTFDVYEDQVNKSGKKIPIDVIILPALSEDALASVFTYHWGGNGSAARDKIWSFESALMPIRYLQDVVLMDDRGTGASNIRCGSMDSLRPNSYALAYDESIINDCLKEVKDQYDLSLYTTPFVVQDFETIRQELGIAQYDFYGISYGVRVGLEYMRQFPDKIRTITLHGCVPPGFNYINEMDLAIQEQLEVLFGRCLTDSTCQSNYPKFREELYAVRDRLKDSPVKVPFELEEGSKAEVQMDDLLFRRMIGHMILNGDVNEAFPLIIHRAYLGNYAPVIMSSGILNLDMPIFLSQFCPEEVKRFSFVPESFNANELFTQGAIGEEKVSACQWWQDLPDAVWLEKPLKSESPILLLTGEYDANTGISMAEQIHQIFPRQSRHIILPHEGHYGGVANNCRGQIIAEFINTQQLESLDTSCLDLLESRHFAFETQLGEKEFEKYIGDYTAADTINKLRILYTNGLQYLKDEFSQFSGPSQLLYKDNHTFTLLDCNQCQLRFSVEDNEIMYVERIYRDTVKFALDGR